MNLDAEVPDAGFPVVDNSDMLSRKAMVVDYLEQRVAWMNDIYGTEAGTIYYVPERDDTPAAPLLNFIMGVPEFEDSQETLTSVLYNLSGIRIDNPHKGEIYIKVTPTGSKKILHK